MAISAGIPIAIMPVVISIAALVIIGIIMLVSLRK
jgi:hypothetical protein